MKITDQHLEKLIHACHLIQESPSNMPAIEAIFGTDVATAVVVLHYYRICLAAIPGMSQQECKVNIARHLQAHFPQAFGAKDEPAKASTPTVAGQQWSPDTGPDASRKHTEPRPTGYNEEPGRT